MSQELVIDTLPGQAATVARRLRWSDALRYAGHDGDRIHAVWRVDRGPLEALSEALRAIDSDIVTVTLDSHRAA